MTNSFKSLAELLLFERSRAGCPAKTGSCWIGVALCTLALLAAGPAQAQASPPVHAVNGGGVFFLEAGRSQGGNLIEHISINARLDTDGSAHGCISSTIVWFSVPPPGGHPDPFGTGTPILYEVTDLAVFGNSAFISAVVVFAPDFPEFVGFVSYFEVVDNDGPPHSGDTVSIDGFDLPPLAAGNYRVR